VVAVVESILLNRILGKRERGRNLRRNNWKKRRNGR